jgi:hypothetical protein
VDPVRFSCSVTRDNEPLVIGSHLVRLRSRQQLRDSRLERE